MVDTAMDTGMGAWFLPGFWIPCCSLCDPALCTLLSCTLCSPCHCLDHMAGSLALFLELGLYVLDVFQTLLAHPHWCTPLTAVRSPSPPSPGVPAQTAGPHAAGGP